MDCTSPIVSVIVPCRNEKDHIEACVRSILAQDLPPDELEVLVADGMSDDGTRKILERLAQEDSRVRVIDNPNRITPCAMNVGVRAARGRYIAIMGAHNHYAPDYLRQSVQVLEQTGADNVGGAMVCEATSWLQQAIAAAHHSAFAVGGARWHDPSYEGPADTVFGGVYRREVFTRIGLFDEELVRNQDDEFNLRLIRAGGKIWQSPRIRSCYRPRNSLGSLFRQYMQYGYWKVRVIQKHTLPASARHLVPGGFVLSLLLLPLVSLWFPFAAWGWLGLVGIYSCSNVAVALLTAARRGWALFPILPLVFACYHFAYGYGFLRGVWDFVVLRRGPNPSYTKLNRIATDRSS
jgi:glycosyltransferase involved in cell wall biosynthesis